MDHQEKIKDREAQLRQKETECRKLRQQLKNMRKQFKLKVTDHAMVRYMERCYNISLQHVEEELITPDVQKYYKEFGDGTYPTGLGSTQVVIKQGAIVTVIN